LHCAMLWRDIFSFTQCDLHSDLRN